jgi:lipoate-protein ligase A
MKLQWEIIDSGSLSPQAIMEKDAQLLRSLQKNHAPILHLYDWDSPCLTYGYFTDPQKHLSLEALQRNQIELARRPTGGGIIFHLTDFAFSVILPESFPGYTLNTLENYALVNHRIANVIKSFKNNQIIPTFLSKEDVSENPCLGFCMAKPTEYDLIVEGKKVGGAAQRRMKQGLLHQASLSLSGISESVLQDILKNKTVVNAMREQSYCLLQEFVTPQELKQARQDLKHLIQNEFLRSVS